MGKVKAFNDILGARIVCTKLMLLVCRDDASIAALIEQGEILIKELQSGRDIRQASSAPGDHAKEGKKIPALVQLLSVSEGDIDIKHLDF